MSLGAGAAVAEQVGKVGVDWLGNDIIVEAIKDPKVEGVTCHVSYFDRGVIDRLQKGNWFEDPSDSSISCRQTGPITIGDIDMSEGGEEVFKQGISLIWKKQVVNRIYDKANETLIYLSHSRQVQNGSAKMSITTVPLYGQNVVWSEGQAEIGGRACDRSLPGLRRGGVKPRAWTARQPSLQGFRAAHPPDGGAEVVPARPLCRRSASASCCAR